MKIFNFINIAYFISKNFQNLFVIFEKILIKLFDLNSHINSEKNKKFLLKKAINFEKFAIDKNKKLFVETIKVTKKIRKNGLEILSKKKIKNHGGAAIEIIYFLIRHYKPNIIFETGVAYGFSSHAIFLAIKKNKLGKLYSSDFPYFREKNPEKLIGIVVPKKFKHNWNLFLKGDKNNLKKIYSRTKKVNFIHYDSDKSYFGRYRFMNSVKKFKKLKFVLMDDLHNNIFFYDYILKNNIKYYKVFYYKKHYVGLIHTN